MYAGALIALVAASAWLGVISAHNGKGAFAGWTVLFYAVSQVAAFALLGNGRRLAAGLAQVVALGLFAVMVGAFFSWFGWLPDHDFPLHGFHLGLLALELIVFLAALVDLQIFRFPLLAAVAAPVGWFFVTDLVSSGGNWSAVVTLVVGLLLFAFGFSLDNSDARPYGFWVHVTAGLLVGGALVYFWHSSTFDWTLIIIASLVYILVGAGGRRSSYAVLGAVGLALATGHLALGGVFSVHDDVSEPTTWAGPVGFLCLGLFLAALGMGLFRASGETETL